MLLSSTKVQRFHQGPPDPVHAVGSGTRVATRVHHSVPHRAAPLPSEPPGPWRPLSSSRPRFCLFQDVTDQSRAARRRLRPAPSLSVVGFLPSGSLTVSPPPRRGPQLPAASLQAATLPRAAGWPVSEDSGRHAPVLRGVGRRATAALSGLDGSLHSATAPWLVSPWELGSGRAPTLRGQRPGPLTHSSPPPSSPHFTDEHMGEQRKPAGGARGAGQLRFTALAWNVAGDVPQTAAPGLVLLPLLRD